MGVTSYTEIGTTGRRYNVGTGSPNSAVTGSVGDMFAQTDGDIGQGLWIKQSGSATNTGWCAVAAYGTSFPAAPFTGQPFFRTDRGSGYWYDGTRWRGNMRYFHHGTQQNVSASGNTRPSGPLNADPDGASRYVERVTCVIYVSPGGTSLDASNKWVAEIRLEPTGIALGGAGYASIATFTLDSGASNLFRSLTPVTVNTAYGGQYASSVLVITKTGTPGTLYIYTSIDFTFIG